MSQSKREDIVAEIEGSRDLFVQLLQNFIRAASPNPPGSTVDAARVITQYLGSHGVVFERVVPPGQEHAPNVVASFDGSRGPGQRDPDLWGERGPYSGYNDGNSIHGRGAADMKAGTAASVIAFVLLHKHESALKGSIALTAVSDEETGGKWGTRYLMENCGSPSPWNGDVVLNGEPGGLQSVRFGEKGTLRITFTVGTQGANGAYMHLTRGANAITAQVIIQLLELEKLVPDLPDAIRKLFEDEEIREVADEIMGTGAADILLKPTVNIGTIHGGAKVNTIPEKCVFEADIRLPIGLTKDTVLQHIHKILEEFPEVTYAVQEAASNPANYLAPDHPFQGFIARAAEEATGRCPVPLVGLGGTDCKFYRYAGIPAYVFGPSPKGMGGSGESVLIDEFIAVIKTHTLAVWDCLAKA